MNLILTNISQLLTCAPLAGERVKRGRAMGDVGLLTHVSIEIRDGRIARIAHSGEEIAVAEDDDIEVIDCMGRVALPGFVDSHTHAVFAGSREDEFVLRAQGRTYQEIARAGGGILSTVKSVREATKKELLKASNRRLNEMMKSGTTTLEIKSGYGLSPESEIKLLDVIAELRRDHFMTVVPTFLGAHAVPPEYAGKKDDYVRLLCEYVIPHLSERKLAEFCDVFCEDGYFTHADAQMILAAGAARGLRAKLHADQLTSNAGAELAAQSHAASADHLEHISSEGIRALAQSDTVATVLPGSAFFLNHTYAPARRMIDEGCAVSIATDFNPGSCMSYSMPMMMTIACTQMRMSPEEAITASTINGAAALGLSAEYGSIEPGKRADIVVYDVPNYRFIPYHFGANHVWKVVKNGTVLEF
ncbi:MAG TPA: imidazolonepropionase [Bacteroidota bacterium]|nr:imidazolonepropionase [Bacteroidota bacterium]